MLNRQNKRYTAYEKAILDKFANSCKDKASMYASAHVIAWQMGRSYCAVCKQVELRNQWFWA